MKNLLFILAIVLSTYTAAVSQEVVESDNRPVLVNSKGEAQVQWYEETESRTQAESRAEALAKVNALEKAFGVVIIQGNSTYVRNVETGETVETTTVFNMIGNSMVKGEIIEIVSSKFTIIENTEKIDNRKQIIKYIKCEISVIAKELRELKLDIVTFPLSKPMRNFSTTTFYENDDLFLFFQSPVSGYVTVYLDDNKYAMRLLPYQQMPPKFENGMPVDADKEYIFFSTAADHNYFEDEYFEEDEYQLYPETQKDLNRLFVIFSKEPLDKPRLSENIDKQLVEELAKDGYSIPKALESDKFQRWLIKNHQIRSDLQVENIIISIEKR